MELAGHKFLKVPLMTVDGTKHIEWKQPQQSAVAEREQSQRAALVCIAKDEDDYIQEWIAYHKKLGFDDIYVY